jgi:hypothetical protein
MRLPSSRHKPLGVPVRMKRTLYTHFYCKGVYLLSCAVLLAAMVSMLFAPALAQKVKDQVIITKIDASAFPDVHVYAVLHDRRGKPIPTGNLGNLTVHEKVFDQEELVSDDRHQFTLKSVSTEAEVLFVIDVAGDLTRLGATQNTYLFEMQSVFNSFISKMKDEDKAGLLVVKGTQVDYLQPLTSDKELLSQRFKEIPQSAENISFGRYGLERAISELSNSPGNQVLAQAVILITPQLFHGDQGLENILARAIEERIAVHSVLTRDNEYADASAPLKLLAARTDGIYVHYRNEASPQPIFDSIAEQRIQTLLAFRSKLGGSSERTIALSVRDVSGTFNAVGTYQVALQPPTIKILSPQSGEVIVRRAESSFTNLELVEPAALPVEVSVNWADGFPREILAAQLIVDDNPTPARFTQGQENLSFEWDLRPFHEPGIRSTRLSIQLQDELGLLGQSEEAVIKIQVSIPEVIPTTAAPGEAAQGIAVVPTPAPTSNAAVCAGLVGFEASLCRFMSLGKMMLTTPSGWVAIGGLLVAIFAIMMAFRYRGPISQAGGKALGTLMETMTQLRRPTESDTGAFLQVLQGDEELLGKSIPLYPQHTTSIGRSLREVELAFQVNQERSVVSRKHCEILGERQASSPDRFRIIDLGSTHGTFVNGERLPAGGDGKVLSPDDQIELGPAFQGGVLLQFKMSRSHVKTQVESPDSRPTYFGGQ